MFNPFDRRTKGDIQKNRTKGKGAEMRFVAEQKVRGRVVDQGVGQNETGFDYEVTEVDPFRQSEPRSRKHEVKSGNASLSDPQCNNEELDEVTRMESYGFLGWR
jgi:hypothetical protein